MKERPIIMSSESVREILAGNKTQTRRVLKKEPAIWTVGDRLWVKESFFYAHVKSNPRYRADYSDWDAEGINWTTPLYMPRKYSRITLEVVSVRAERLQEISEVDAILEGCESREAYRKRWDEINGKRYPWESNPFVWVIEFKMIDGKK